MKIQYCRIYPPLPLPEGDFSHLKAFMMLTAGAPFGVWGEIIRLDHFDLIYRTKILLFIQQTNHYSIFK
jgi:hypothetical protein